MSVQDESRRIEFGNDDQDKLRQELTMRDKRQHTNLEVRHASSTRPTRSNKSNVWKHISTELFQASVYADIVQPLRPILDG